MRVAVFSGSFNPLHIGHKAIVEHLVKEMKFKKVYLVVSPKNPLKEAANSDDSLRRYRDAEKVLSRFELGGVELCDIEFGLPRPSYTITTLDALKKREKKNRFVLVCGADQLADFRRWKDYQRILLEYGVIAFPRGDYDLEKIKDELLVENGDYKIEIANALKLNISSSYIRDNFNTDGSVKTYLWI